MKATAKAHTNIALIKYWGKRDQALFLPMNSSLSLTLDAFYTTTTVAFKSDIKEDVFMLDGHRANEAASLKVSLFLDKIRGLGDIDTKAVVTSINHVPYAAGFASSASGYAALAAAGVKALALPLDRASLSILARQGSGSASRSVYGGFVKWNKGQLADGTDSYAEQLLKEEEWQVSVLSVHVTSEEKKISSRDGMAITVATSPFYDGWLSTVAEDLTMAEEAIHDRNFTQLGQVSESNALKMHATMLGARPPVCYWNPTTMAVMMRVKELRQEGYEAYYTVDAGPNVKVLCLPGDEALIQARLMEIPTVEKVIPCHPGPGITYIT